MTTRVGIISSYNCYITTMQLAGPLSSKGGFTYYERHNDLSAMSLSCLNNVLLQINRFVLSERVSPP